VNGRVIVVLHVAHELSIRAFDFSTFGLLMNWFDDLISYQSFCPRATFQYCPKKVRRNVGMQLTVSYLTFHILDKA